MLFSLGRCNQAELSERIDPVLALGDGYRLHLHNQLLSAIYGNVTREMPDQGPAPWVSANDKPSAAVGSKPVSGDAAERRLKGDVMQLPTRDRRRIKDLVHNEVSYGLDSWLSTALGMLIAADSLIPTSRLPMFSRTAGSEQSRSQRYLPVPAVSAG